VRAASWSWRSLTSVAVLGLLGFAITATIATFGDGFVSGTVRESDASRDGLGRHGRDDHGLRLPLDKSPSTLRAATRSPSFGAHRRQRSRDRAIASPLAKQVLHCMARERKHSSIAVGKGANLTKLNTGQRAPGDELYRRHRAPRREPTLDNQFRLSRFFLRLLGPGPRM
jgi:hypothetical protein